MAILADRLDFTYVQKIRKCATIRLMIEHFDAEFCSASDTKKIITQNAYRSLKFNVGGDLKKYIDIHESRAAEYEEAGGILTNEDRINTLSMSLPHKYDSILKFYRLEPQPKNYQTYRTMLWEK